MALCQMHPKEAAEQLYARRFDPWLSRWGERQAAKAVLTATMRTADQAAGLAAFLTGAAPAPAAKTTAARPSAQATRQRTTQQPPRTGQSARGTTTHAAASAAPSATASLVTVQPRTIDFGQLKQGQRGAVTITISGQNGVSVNGQLIPPPSWITLDRQSFSGSSTLVQLTAETTKIAAKGKQYSSLQIVTGAQHIYVPITAEIVRAPRATTRPAEQRILRHASPRRSGRQCAASQAKYAAPPLGRPLNLGFLGALLLAIGLSVDGAGAATVAVGAVGAGAAGRWPADAGVAGADRAGATAGRAHWQRRQRLAGTLQHDTGGRGPRVPGRAGDGAYGAAGELHPAEADYRAAVVGAGGMVDHASVR